MPGREYQAQPSRFGFNGKENDNDVKGFGNQQDYGMRIYDTRLGKFLSVDPIQSDYPFVSPYAFAENDVMRSIDLDGLEKFFIIPLPIGRPLMFCFGCDIAQINKDFVQGSQQKYEATTKTANYHNENVPSAVQQKLEDINTKNGNVKVIGASVDFTIWHLKNDAEAVSYIIPVGEGMSLVCKGLGTLVRFSPKARNLAYSTAERIIETTTAGKLPRGVTVMVDKETGRVYEGISGALKDRSMADPKLLELAPEKSLEKWDNVLNCSECDALNKALKDGAKLENLEMHTVKIDKSSKTITDFERCQNCKVTTKDVKTTSDKKRK